MFGPLGSEKYEEYSSDIYDSGAYLLGVINDILDMSKIEAGHLSLEYERIRPGENCRRNTADHFASIEQSEN